VPDEITIANGTIPRQGMMPFGFTVAFEEKIDRHALEMQ
jgi:hypothetical protein